MFKIKSLAAVAFAVAASSSAFASSVVLAGGPVIWAGSFAGNASSNVFTLDLTAVSAGAQDFFADITVNFAGEQYFNVDSVKLDAISFVANPLNGVPSGSNEGEQYFSYSGMVNPALPHTITVLGTSSQGSGFTGTVSFAMSPIPPAPPVPEPETYAMMLAGLGALGFLARRRKNA